MTNLWSPGETNRGEISSLKKCLLDYYHLRALLQTHAGYLGLGFELELELGLDTVEPDDETWLLAGTRTLFAPRPTEDASGENRSKVIAGCYVHGAMYAKLVGGREDVIFRLAVIA